MTPDETLHQLIDNAIRESNSIKPKFGDIVDYNEHMRYRYSLTIKDVIASNKQLNILEIGAFTGVVSAVLAKLGHSVMAHDIPFIIEDPRLAAFLESYGVKTVSLDLKNTFFPIASSQYDLIIFNEVLEHLNFNSIPLLNEFARLLKPRGHVYCATPNLASLKNRLLLLRGEGFLSPISSYKLQLVPDKATSVGLHWREWSKAELVDLFDAAGLEMQDHVYRLHVSSTSRFFRRTVVSLLYAAMPSLMPGQVGRFVKRDR